MPTKNITPLVRNGNEQIVDAIRNGASLDYQRRIPSATQAGIQETLKNLVEYRAGWNEFVDALVNRIGAVEARNISWTNPLAEFKRGMLNYGDTIEEIQVGLLKAHVYDPDREYMERAIFGTETPDVQANFHKVNRQEYYKITINEDLLRRAFLEEGGISKFVAAMMQAPTTSDQWDEFLLTTSLFAEYERMGGFHHVHVPDVRSLSSDGADARGALRRMRSMADTLKFPSTRYNAAKMPTFAQPDDLVLFATPDAIAAFDVEALAAAFNVDHMNVSQRIIPIPDENFGIDGAQAIMTTRDFFVIADQTIDTTSQYNPVSRSTNYFLHHWQVISASRFVPAVMFWTGADDEAIEIKTPVTAVAAPTFENSAGETVTSGKRGALYQALTEVTTDPEDGPNTGVSWSVSGNTSNRTFITQTGVLHIGGRETSASLTVKATSTWVDSAGVRREAISNGSTFGVTGGLLPEWPVKGEIFSITVKGVAVTGVKPDVTTYTVEVAELPVEVGDVVVEVENGASVDVAVDPDGDVVTITVGDADGTPAVYTVTVTEAV